jgi:hypothetical protein
LLKALPFERVWLDNHPHPHRCLQPFQTTRLLL